MGLRFIKQSKMEMQCYGHVSFEPIKEFLLPSFEMKEMGEVEMILDTRIKPKDNVILCLD